LRAGFFETAPFALHREHSFEGLFGAGLALRGRRRTPFGGRDPGTWVQSRLTCVRHVLPREPQLGKLFLLSIVFAPIVLPLRAARAKNARKGFRKTIIHMALFNVFYLFVLLFIYGRF
jgi:hypothetical protein